MSESAHAPLPRTLLPQRSKLCAVHPLRTGQCGHRHWRGTAIGGNQVRLQAQPQRMDVRRPPVVQRQDRSSTSWQVEALLPGQQ